MTDWDLINEYIANAMQAVDKAHEVTNGLRENATPEAFDQFRLELEVLTDHLTQLQTVLSHQDTYALDELADWLSDTFGGQHAEYRHTPHMELNKTKD
jgi:hypothetical protein